MDEDPASLRPTPFRNIFKSDRDSDIDSSRLYQQCESSSPVSTVQGNDTSETSKPRLSDADKGSSSSSSVSTGTSSVSTGTSTTPTTINADTSTRTICSRDASLTDASPCDMGTERLSGAGEPSFDSVSIMEEAGNAAGIRITLSDCDTPISSVIVPTTTTSTAASPTLTTDCGSTPTKDYGSMSSTNYSSMSTEDLGSISTPDYKSTKDSRGRGGAKTVHGQQFADLTPNTSSVSPPATASTTMIAPSAIMAATEESSSREEAPAENAPLSNLIKAALAESRHTHQLAVSSYEEDSSRLYQSDSYLPALRLQMDTAKVNSRHEGPPTHNTLPRTSSKSTAAATATSMPPMIQVSTPQHDALSHHSSYSHNGSPYYRSLDDPALSQTASREKLSPPTSPLTKGLHCSSLSLYLPPPSISSLNKMWHRCYSGESDSGDGCAPDESGSHLSSSKKRGGAGDKLTHYDLAAKVILLGDYSVGKTSFLSTLSRAKDENGSGFCRQHRPGELAEVVFKRQQKRAMIRVMDTGGQERYRSMTSSYYRGVHGCLLVFDVTREETFNNIMIWHSDLLKYSTDQYVAAILVGTTSHPGDRVISPERGLKMAESLGMPYMECSPEDEAMTLAVVQRLTESVIKFALRRTSFAIDIKPQTIVRLGEEKKNKKFVCLC